jgi:hypothetical protein
MGGEKFRSENPNSGKTSVEFSGLIAESTIANGAFLLAQRVISGALNP